MTPPRKRKASPGGAAEKRARRTSPNKAAPAASSGMGVAMHPNSSAPAAPATPTAAAAASAFSPPRSARDLQSKETLGDGRLSPTWNAPAPRVMPQSPGARPFPVPQQVVLTPGGTHMMLPGHPSPLSPAHAAHFAARAAAAAAAAAGRLPFPTAPPTGVTSPLMLSRESSILLMRNRRVSVRPSTFPPDASLYMGARLWARNDPYGHERQRVAGAAAARAREPVVKLPAPLAGTRESAAVRVPAPCEGAAVAVDQLVDSRVDLTARTLLAAHKTHWKRVRKWHVTQAAHRLARYRERLALSMDDPAAAAAVTAQ